MKKYIWMAPSGRQYLLTNKRESPDNRSDLLDVYDILSIIKDVPVKDYLPRATNYAYLYRWENVVEVEEPMDILKEML